MLREDYRKSLKLPEAEEVFDLLVYRPLAFILVQGIHRLPVTPNQVTLFSLLTGFAAAWCFAAGTAAAATWGACWYAAANILDCADGQLARLQKSGTFLGRVLDGAADYVSSIAIFLSLGIGFAAAGEPRWLLVVLGGLSSALHAMLFDHYQNAFISRVRGETNFLRREMEQFIGELNRLQGQPRSGLRRLLLRLYLRYLGAQQKTAVQRREPQVSPEQYRKAHGTMIRLWSILGPTTNRTLLICCAVAGRPEVFLWIVVAGLNGWMLVAALLERRIQKAETP